MRGDRIIFVLIIGVVAIAFVLAMRADIRNQKKYADCRNACGVYVANVIDEQCFCKTTTGWEAK